MSVQLDYHRSNGFTLLEMMIVAAIIGVVSAAALPAYQGYIETSKMTRVTASYENAVRITQQVFSKATTRLAIGLSSGIPSNDCDWIKLYNPKGHGSTRRGASLRHKKTDKDLRTK